MDLNSYGKKSYENSKKEIEEIYNIYDSYRNICITWCRWLKKNNIGLSLYSFKEYYNYLLVKHYSASTINMNLVMMRRRLLYLFDQVNDSIDKRATFEYQMKAYKPPSLSNRNISEDKIFTKKEINKIIQYSGKRTSLIIEFFYETACRRNEFCNVMLKDCQEKRNYIEIKLYGKRNKIRSVVISKNLFKRIQETFNGNVYLFEKNDNVQYNGHCVWDLVSAAGRRYINKKISPHMIRHTRLTHLYEETSDMKAVSLFAGHTSIKTSLDYYVHHGFKPSILIGSIEDQ